MKTISHKFFRSKHRKQNETPDMVRATIEMTYEEWVKLNKGEELT